MTKVWIPETFSDRPYAQNHFASVVLWAQQNHAFYQRFHTDISAPLPVIKRAQVQQFNDLLLNGHAAIAHTSGSISMPIKVSWDPARSKREDQDVERLIAWYGGKLTAMKIVALATHKANLHTLEVGSPLPEQWAFIEHQYAQYGATSLVSYPTNLEQLCHYAIEHGLSLPYIARVTAMSETFDAHMDALLKRVFPNAVVVVTYSSVECGMIAIRCPHNPQNYHIMASKLGVEILNEQDQPCAIGELGQVVVTDYFNQHSSLIRYALGDLAEPANCTCGKIEFPAITHIAGKMRGLLRRADGSQMLFTSLSSTFRDSQEISQFQVVQMQIQCFTINAVLRNKSEYEAFEARIRHRFVQEFGPQTELLFNYTESIPRSPGGKYFAAICAIPEAEK
jgi:phenylacetate-coenzyme A ligase PaaK-like adenylate-forming protein